MLHFKTRQMTYVGKEVCDLLERLTSSMEATRLHRDETDGGCKVLGGLAEVLRMDPLRASSRSR